MMMPVIAATWESEIGELWFKTSPGKKLARPYLKDKPGMVVHTCNPMYMEGRGRTIVALGKNLRNYLKNN
jgi:hypothetical protein